MAEGDSKSVALTAILIALLASGCATTRSATDSVGGWFGRAPVSRPDTSIRPSAWYAGSAGVSVYTLPDASSEVVAKLARNEAVLRYQRKDGFAYVVAEKGGRAGWVSERALIAKLPVAPRATTAPTAPAAPDAGATPSPAEPEATEERPDEETAPPAPPQKSIFDPY